ncbi:hypothetical protein P344_00725 [Spiroplasma mirum ATCC 29335]|uniref:Metallophosphoesterase n=1 Tax=Spiroplasma mirum ATCC 29335 TaxID=838561 RepID=W0GK16_9MOLU|nr:MULTISPECIES: TIGR00282 family metallophosphoesterase [Spiroplasma]AHF60585.1 hypothetical protein SMM_0118 [Spiroplasma mirum ATCC 29335]AHI57518.1 hypothetical protein P344_00725 [Spiroplasma mirum ATCC 29335]AKM52704.1 putative metallophosphatase [Spiroplasma atrichopogonis]
MKILMIGDIYAKAGRKALEEYLPFIMKKYQIQFVVANGENTSHGKSILRKHYEELKALQVDVITSGNHIFKNPEVPKYIEEVDDLLKPLNMNPYTPGSGTVVKKVGNKTIRVTNLIGRSFMDPADNPHYALEKIVAEDNSDLHLVDFHAEASAEKLALAWNFDGKITCLVGTHTHVQTTDNRILPNGTAYITDLGMCGSYNSIIGANPEEVILKEKTGLPSRFQPAEDLDNLIFSGIILETDNVDNSVIKIDRILITPDNQDKYR